MKKCLLKMQTKITLKTIAYNKKLKDSVDHDTCRYISLPDNEIVLRSQISVNHMKSSSFLL